MKYLLSLLCLLCASCAHNQKLTRAEALQLGADNGGIGNGSFWHAHGDATPPFSHAGSIYISQGNSVTLELNDEKDTRVGLHPPSSDGSQTRLDFFTSKNGQGWVVSSVLEPEYVDEARETVSNELPPKHAELCHAAKLAISYDDTYFLEVLFVNGLQINEPLETEYGDTLLHEACWGKLDVVKFLLEHGADPSIRNLSGKLPIHNAIFGKEEEICKLLAGPEVEEPVVDQFPAGLIEAVLPYRYYRNEVMFVSWNDSDPSEALLAEIQKTIPRARPNSQMESVDRRPLGAPSYFRDKDSKEFGYQIIVKLNKDGDVWNVDVCLAGEGGWEGIARQAYGYWYIDVTRSFDI